MRASLLVIIALLIFFPLVGEAQCSMCRLMAESSYESGSQIGRGLNDGITYIMGIPYVLIAIVGFVLFRKNFSK